MFIQLVVKSLISSAPSSQQPLRRPSLPFTPAHNRFSTVSSANSVLGFLADSKYAMPFVSYNQTSRVALPDPMFDLYDRADGPVDDDDYMHEPDGKNQKMGDTSWRGVLNVSGMSPLWLLHIMLPLYRGTNHSCDAIQSLPSSLSALSHFSLDILS